MTYVYKYQPPEDNGYTKVNIPRSLHNSIFKYKAAKAGLRPYRQRTLFKSLFVKYEYYYNHWNIKVQVLPTLLTKVLTTLLVPINLIFCGLSNYKYVFRDVQRTWCPKKTGSFIEDDIQGEVYKEVMGKLFN